jgi:ribosomal protein S18 acetylase RimI-like enzyme
VTAIRPYREADEAAVCALWQACGLTRPWNPPDSDIAFLRSSGHGELLLAEHAGEIVGSVMVGHDGHRGWVYYVAVDPDHRGKEYGRTIMAAAEDWLRQRGVVKVVLLVRSDNTKVQAFYETLDYAEQDRVIYAKWLDGREPTP